MKMVCTLGFCNTAMKLFTWSSLSAAILDEEVSWQRSIFSLFEVTIVSSELLYLLTGVELSTDVPDIALVCFLLSDALVFVDEVLGLGVGVFDFEEPRDLLRCTAIFRSRSGIRSLLGYESYPVDPVIVFWFYIFLNVF